MFTDHATQWSGIEFEKQKKLTIEDSKFEISFGGQTFIKRNPLASTSHIRFKAVACLPGNPK